MKHRILSAALIVTFFMVSCKKETNNTIPAAPPAPSQHRLLKDLIEPSLPSPYYHFVYRADSTISSLSFASGFTMYDVFYSGGMISEMRNNIIVNHDTLRYIYGDMNHIATINFINQAGIIYRHALFHYDSDRISEIDWDHKDDVAGFVIDRTLTFTYFPDGNVKEIKEHRPANGIETETNFTTAYDQYDDKINVDDFTLWEDGFHDHLFLLSGLHLQKNNPRKEVRTGDGANYTVDYAYTYDGDGAPLEKDGNLIYTTGTQAGQRFHVSTIYSYY